MVFPEILYYNRTLLCWAFGPAPDLVAPANNSGLEDRPHDRDPRSQLDPVSNHNGIHSCDQGVLQDYPGAMR